MSTAQAHPEQSAPPPMSIVALDDDADFREYLSEALRTEGHDVRVVGTPEAFFSSVEEHVPDLVLLDMKMGKRSGEEVLVEIRERWAKLCVVVVTGYPSMETMRETFKLDVFDYLTKPFSLDELRRVLSQAAIAFGLGGTPQDRLRQELGRRVRLSRTGAGWTLKDLSEQSGVSVSQLSSIERGRAPAQPRKPHRDRRGARFAGEHMDGRSRLLIRDARRRTQTTNVDLGIGRRRVYTRSMASARTVSLLVNTLGSISAGAIRTHDGHTDTTKEGLEVVPDLIELMARSICLHARASENELQQVELYLKRLIRRYGTMRHAIEALGERRRRHRQISQAKVQSWADVMSVAGIRVETAMRRHPPVMIAVTRYVSSHDKSLRTRLEAYLAWLDGPLPDLSDSDQLTGLGASAEPEPASAPVPEEREGTLETNAPGVEAVFAEWFAHKHLSEPAHHPALSETIETHVAQLEHADDLFQNAVAAVARLDFDRADAQIVDLRKRHSDPRIDELRAERYYLERNYDAAVESYRFVREQAGVTPYRCVGLAMSLLHANKGSYEQRVGEAIDLLNDARKRHTEGSSEWAQVGAMLGFARLHQPAGDRDGNVRLGIELFEESLGVITRENDPQWWADVHLHLGTAWQALPTGRRQENLQRAITCFSRAGEEWTRESDPERWAAVQNNLGHAWERLPGGTREGNLKRAIDYFLAALSVHDEQASPLSWATLQNNIGNAWVKVGAGESGEYINRAIECHSAALRVWSSLDKRAEWAATQNNLGNAWALLPTDGPERERNLRRSISCYKSALEVRTRGTAPHDWASTQNNLGSALLLLREGDVSSTVREAIACFERALEVRTRTASPLEWAKTQCNIGNAWSRLIGPGHNKRDSLTNACDHYRAALEVITHDAHPHQHGYVYSRLQSAKNELAGV